MKNDNYSRRLRGVACTSALALVIGCANGEPDSGGGSSGASSGGTGASAGSTPSGSGANAVTSGEPSGVASGSSTGAASGAGSSGADMPDANAGADAPPAGGSDAMAGGYDSSATDPGTQGDGDRVLNGPFRAAPEFTPGGAAVPKGKSFRFVIPNSTIFPKAPARTVAVYVPAQYKAGTPAPVMVYQDGTNFYGFDSSIPVALDNLIAKGSIPVMVAVFASNGGGDAVGSERGLEYDTVSGLYAEWADKELLPAVEKQSQTSLPTQAVTFTHDPEGRGAVGGSSGGAGSFGMVWWHPDLFRRVITFSGTYVNQVPLNSPFPHGCWVYHDVDPYNMAAPNGLIVQHCESATNPFAGSSNPGPCDTPLSKTACEAVAGCQWNTQVNKPIRIWHESGTNDLGTPGGPGTYRNFDLANQRMAASFKLRGYHYHYDHAIGAGHVDGGAWHQIFPEAMTWLWRGFQGPK
jgi:iron(III)-enterobactin esterase